MHSALHWLSFHWWAHVRGAEVGVYAPLTIAATCVIMAAPSHMAPTGMAPAALCGPAGSAGWNRD